MTSPRLDAESISGWRSMKCRTTRKPTTLIRARSACRRRTTGGVRPGVKDRASSPALDWRLCLLDSVPRLYMAGVRAKSAKNTPPLLSGFSRKACAICKRETSGQMPNLPYISQISRFSSDELGVCPCISMIGVYREFRVGFNDNPRGESEFMGTRAGSQMRRTPHAAHITILAKHVGHEFPDCRCHEPFLDIRSR